MPQEHLDGRVHDIPQANVLGGGSSVNAQVYMRGRPSDYDEWHDLLHGDNDYPGWGWADVLPHFRTMEGNNRLYNELHGADGPLLVSDPGHINDMSRWFVQAVQALGEPFNPDFNGPKQRGVGFYQFMNRRGKRSSAAYAFLAPLADNPNLVIRLQSRVRKIEIENGRAVGVTYRDAKGVDHQVYADGEVIVASGALVTPQLLMLSGIGPADQLREHGIACIADLPGVGENLIDHPEVPIIAKANGPYGYYRQGVGWRMLLNGLHFRLFGSGPILSAGVEAGAFVNPADPNAEPTIQAFCVPIVYLDRDTLGLVDDTYGLTITTVVVKPKSRGYVRLRSSDPDDMPLVSPNLLKHPDDARTMIDGQRFFIRAFRTSPLGRAHRAHLDPRSERSERRGDHEALPSLRENELSPERHVPNGDSQRPDGRARFQAPRPRHREPARLRPLGHAQHQRGQHERPRHDAGQPLRRAHHGPRHGQHLPIRPAPVRTGRHERRHFELKCIKRVHMPDKAPCGCPMFLPLRPAAPMPPPARPRHRLPDRDP